MLKQLAQKLFAKPVISDADRILIIVDPRFQTCVGILRESARNYNARIPGDLSQIPADIDAAHAELLKDIKHRVTRDKISVVEAISIIFDDIIEKGPQNTDQAVIDRFVASVRRLRKSQRSLMELAGGWGD